MQRNITMAAVPITVFALTPAQADNLIIKYTFSEGKKLDALGAAKLNILYDGNLSNQNTFL